MALQILSIVIPVYNERDFIESALKRVVSAKTPGFKKELVIVDDGSKDKSPQILKRIVPKIREAKVILICKKKNEGKGSALKTGLLKTTGDIVLIQDADLEYDPNDYVLLLEPFLKDGADVVYGSRMITNKPHRILYFWHYLVNNFLTTLSNMFTNLNLTDMETGYKAFKGTVIRKIAPKLESKRFGFEPEITARIAKIKEVKIYEVGISYSGRTYKEGKKIGWKDGLKAVWEIIKFNLLK